MNLEEAQKRMCEGWYLTNDKISLYDSIYMEYGTYFLKKIDGSKYVIPCELAEQVKDSWHFQTKFLTSSERDYLEHALRPWKDHIDYIVRTGGEEKGYIKACFDDGSEFSAPRWDSSYKTMYSDMRLNTNYSPKELGLWMPEEETE